MVTVVRRAFWLSLVAGACAAAWVALRSRRIPEPTQTAAEWPPFDSPTADDPPATQPIDQAAPDLPDDTPASTASPGWVAPDDAGTCPLTHPVKAGKSGIYHVPTGRSYERTAAARCYASAAEAESDGYRPAKA